MPYTALHKESFTYRLLTGPSYRIARHLLLILGLAIIGISQGAYMFVFKFDVIETRIIYWAAAIIGGVYLLGGYIHVYWLVPRLLMRKRYFAYLLVSVTVIGLLALARPGLEYAVYSYFETSHVRISYTGLISVLDILSEFSLVFLCITGASLTVLLRYWVDESRRVGQLEKRLLQSEVETLKEQINPELLLKTLHRTGTISPNDPGRAADMILTLSRLLRYQLYDGNRNRVFVSTEIDFVRHYLMLEQSYRGGFGYDVQTEGDLSRFQVPPLVFIPFVQQAARNGSYVEVTFTVTADGLLFECRYTGFAEDKTHDFSRILARLGRIYGTEFSFGETEIDEDEFTYRKGQLKLPPA